MATIRVGQIVTIIEVVRSSDDRVVTSDDDVRRIIGVVVDRAHAALDRAAATG